MKAAILTLTLAAFGLQASAQSFVNGSLEGNSAVCNRVFNFKFPTFVGNAGYAFGTTLHGPQPGMIYFMDGSCGEGAAQKGTNFLGLSSNDAGEVDAMALTLNTALQANKTYTLTFYIKKPKTQPTIALEIGYTTDSLKFGTMVRTVEAPSSSNWVLVTVNFRPTVSTRFVTVRGVKSSTGTFAYSYAYVDNFNITPGVGVAPEQKTFAVAPHPNPFLASFSLSLAPELQFPCQVTLSDFSGRLVHEQSVSSREVSIPRGTMSPGIYLLNIRDANGTSSYSRVLAE